jgi:peptidylprolyl isomerase
MRIRATTAALVMTAVCSAAFAGEVSVATPAGTVTTPSGLQYIDAVVGTGEAAVQGKKATVHYAGTLGNGKNFDNSRERGRPFAFKVGAGEVIRGWDEGIEGMKVGGKRRLIIPPRLGYGSRGVPGVIPGNTTLFFDVELLGVEK